MFSRAYKKCNQLIWLMQCAVKLNLNLKNKFKMFLSTVNTETYKYNILMTQLSITYK